MGAEPAHACEEATGPAVATAAAVGPIAMPSRGPLSRSTVVALQRLVGNAAVAGMIAAGDRRPETAPTGDALPVEPAAVAVEPLAPPAAPAEAASQAAPADGGPLAALSDATPAPADTGPVAAPAVAGPVVPTADVAPPAAGGNGAPLVAGPAVAASVVAGPVGPTADVAPPAVAGDSAAGPVVGAADAAPPAAVGDAASVAAAPADAAPPAARADVAPAGGARAAPAAGPPPAAEAAAPPAPAQRTEPDPPGSGGEVRDPHAAPGFQVMTGAAHHAGATTKTHQPAPVGAATAQGAAEPPANDAPSQAAAAQVDEMSKQEPVPFDKRAFVAAIKQAIAATAPKNLEQAEEFKSSGKAGQVADQVKDHTKDGKKKSEKKIKDAKDAPPDTSKAKRKAVKPMVHDEPGSKSKGVGAAGAMPAKRPPGQTDLSGGPTAIDAKMAQAEVTEEQLEDSNEPEFKDALKERDKLKEHAHKAPAEYREKEHRELHKGHGDAESAADHKLVDMHAGRTKALAKAVESKGRAKSADEQRREKVASDIQRIFDRTKSDVTKRLHDLDGRVDSTFTHGEKAARAQFDDYVDGRMRAYKDARYGGAAGKLRWVKDKLTSMPEEVNRFYEQGRKTYLQRMDGVIDKVADVVGKELTAARARIAEGRADVQRYVARLPQELQEVGKEAEGKLESGFDELTSDVDAKKDALVDTIAKKYVAARDSLDAHIKELQEKNKGLKAKAEDKINAVVGTINKLRSMLMSLLARVAGAIGEIMKHPVRFLKTLIGGITAGLQRFAGNIGRHLQQGLMGWLFGMLGGAGLRLPKTLDLAGIVDLVTQILGLTWDNVRARLVKHVGEPVAARMEQSVDVIKSFASKGIGGSLEFIRDHVGDLEDTVVGQIKDFVTERVITAGVKWVAALFGPVGAFIKACSLIYDVISWVIERGSQLASFVSAVLDSIASIAKGSIEGVAAKIEDALSDALPLAISFFASLIGIGGLSDRIKSIIEKVRAPINRGIDKVVIGAVNTFKKLFAAPIAAAKRKVKQGKAWVKGKVERGKAWVKGKVERGKASVKRAVKRVIQLVQGFTLHDERHEIRTDPEGRLVVASSSPKPVSAFDKLVALNKEYEALDDTAPEARRRAIIMKMIRTIKQDLGLLVEVLGHGIGDAPNLGHVAPWRDQARRFRPRSGQESFARLWELEAEHVIPRSYVSQLFLSDPGDDNAPGLPAVSDTEYRSMHTIMIYRGAADYKTADGDNASDLKNLAVLKVRLRQAVDKSRASRGVDPAASKQSRDVLRNAIRTQFERFAVGARRRTVTAIGREHEDRCGTLAKDKVRAPEAAPSESRVEEAARRQHDDIQRFLDERLDPGG